MGVKILITIIGFKIDIKISNLCSKISLLKPNSHRLGFEVYVWWGVLEAEERK